MAFSFRPDNSHQSINPYTFIPPRTDDKYLKSETVSNAWFDKAKYSVKVKCDIEFLTPALIPGRRRPATTKDLEGMLWAYRHEGRPAIPGSRLRGHFLHLMRLINGSPMKPGQYVDTPILERRPRDPSPSCGIIKAYKEETGRVEILRINGKSATCYKPDGAETKGVLTEILVAGNDRPGVSLLQNGAKLQSCRFGGDIFIFDPKTNRHLPVPELDPDQPYSTQGAVGEADWEHPAWGPPGTRQHKMYMAMPEKGNYCKGRWVKIPAWSGQDGKNHLKDTTSNEAKTHHVVWHLVDLDTLSASDLEFDVANFRTTANALADAAKDDNDKKAYADDIGRMKDWLKPGTFVYFNKAEKSFGLHFQYFRYPARVHTPTSPAGDAAESAPCIVDGIQGAANEGEQSGPRSRFWAEMAFADDGAPKTEEVNLRILSSQPPKAASFYLKPNGRRPAEWGTNSSQIRGRKVYWHDPKYDKPLWDDAQDDHCAFENPDPSILQNQWSRAELVQPKTQYTVTLRCLNFSKDELNLLLTALVGFNPQSMEDGGLMPGGTKDVPDWCHKIGGARAFMGSARIGISKIERLGFDPETLAPVMGTAGDNTPDSLKQWQTDKLGESKDKHLESLKRVMRYYGAYEKDDPNLNNRNVRITWPTGQDRTRPNQPYTVFNWFSFNKDRHNSDSKTLPLPLDGKPQALPAWTKTRDQGYGPPNNRPRR